VAHHSLSTLPPWVLALAVTALATAVWLSFRGFRFDPAGARRVALLGFRLAAALLVLVLLLEPGSSCARRAGCAPASRCSSTPADR